MKPIAYKTMRKKIKRIQDDLKRNASDLTYLRDNNLDVTMRPNISYLLGLMEFDIQKFQEFQKLYFKNSFTNPGGQK